MLSFFVFFLVSLATPDPRSITKCNGRFAVSCSVALTDRLKVKKNPRFLLRIVTDLTVTVDQGFFGLSRKNIRSNGQ